MEKMPIYRWTGYYFGFIYNDRLFDANSHYIGWIDEEGRVWHADGSFLGEIIEDNYVLRRESMIEPIPRIPKIPPIPPIPPIPKLDRLGRLPKLGWMDALNVFK